MRRIFARMTLVSTTTNILNQILLKYVSKGYTSPDMLEWLINSVVSG